MADEKDLSTELSKERTGLSHERTGLSHERTGLSHERTALAHERTDLAMERTLLAHERTLMAWVRTATSLISFGFTIYKAFDLAGAGQDRIFGAREFAMTMIGIGLLSLALATIDHARSRRTLAALTTTPPPRSLALIIAALIAVLGVVGFLVAALRV